MNKQKNHTLSDIAERLGVSTTAVSMALRNSGGVSDKLRTKVLDAAEEMDYRPALAAKMLRSKKTGQLGMYMPTGNVESIIGRDNWMTPSMIHFVKQCEDNDYSYHIEYGAERSKFIPPSQLTGRIVDGVLLLGAQNPELMKWFEANPQYKWLSIIEEAEYCVLSDNFSGIYQAVEYLAAMGHRKIGFVHCDIEFAAHHTALEGYLKAVSDFGLEAEDYLTAEIISKPNGLNFEDINSWADYILDDSRRPSAIISNDSTVTNGLMLRAANRGVRIPDDLSLISFGLKSSMENVFPNVTSVEVDFGSIMKEGIDMLSRRIDDREILKKQIQIKPVFVKRDSVIPYKI